MVPNSGMRFQSELWFSCRWIMNPGTRRERTGWAESRDLYGKIQFVFFKRVANHWVGPGVLLVWWLICKLQSSAVLEEMGALENRLYGTSNLLATESPKSNTDTESRKMKIPEWHGISTEFPPLPKLCPSNLLSSNHQEFPELCGNPTLHSVESWHEI